MEMVPLVSINYHLTVLREEEEEEESDLMVIRLWETEIGGKLKTDYLLIKQTVT